MKFSIVTPSLNQGNYIRETIESVLSQAGEFSIDYIISDGGSTDQTVEIIKEYETKLQQGTFPISCEGITLRWWSAKDNGQSEAINKGFALAAGEVLAWLNSDDYYEPFALERAAELFRANSELDLLYGSGYMLDEATGTKTPVDNYPTDFDELRVGGNSIFQPSAFLSKRILEKVNYLDESLHFVMDLDLWLKVLRATRMSLYDNFRFATFRQWPDSKSGSSEPKFKRENRALWEKYGGPSFDPSVFSGALKKTFLFRFLHKKAPKTVRTLKTAAFRLLSLMTSKKQ